MTKSQLNQERRKALRDQYNVGRFELNCDIAEWPAIKAKYDKSYLLKDRRKKSPS